MENLMNCENNNYENESTNIDEILANSQNGVIEALKIINNQNKKRDAKIEILTGDINSTKTKVESLEKNTNVICSPFHSKRKRNFKTALRTEERKTGHTAGNSGKVAYFPVICQPD